MRGARLGRRVLSALHPHGLPLLSRSSGARRPSTRRSLWVHCATRLRASHGRAPAPPPVGRARSGQFGGRRAFRTSIRDRTSSRLRHGKLRHRRRSSHAAIAVIARRHRTPSSRAVTGGSVIRDPPSQGPSARASSSDGQRWCRTESVSTRERTAGSAKGSSEHRERFVSNANGAANSNLLSSPPISDVRSKKDSLRDATPTPSERGQRVAVRGPAHGMPAVGSRSEPKKIAEPKKSVPQKTARARAAHGGAAPTGPAGPSERPAPKPRQPQTEPKRSCGDLAETARRDLR
jgi:hypothetical protein